MSKDIKFLVCILVWFAPTVCLSFTLDWLGYETNDPMGLVYLMLSFGVCTVVCGVMMRKWGLNE